MIDKKFILKFFSWATTIPVVVAIAVYREYPAIHIFYVSVGLFVYSFLVTYYENVFIPKRLSKETIKALNGLEEIGFKFVENKYLRSVRGRNIEVKYRRSGIERYPTAILTLHTKESHLNELRKQLNNSLKTKYQFGSGHITMEHEINDMRTFLPETKEEIARLLAVLESVENG